MKEPEKKTTECQRCDQQFSRDDLFVRGIGCDMEVLCAECLRVTLVSMGLLNRPEPGEGDEP
jgi:hypothetical protein